MSAPTTWGPFAVRLSAWATWTSAGFVVNGPPLPAKAGPLAILQEAPPLQRIHSRVRRPDALSESMVRLCSALVRGAERVLPSETGLVVGTSAGSRATDAAFSKSVATKGRAFGSPSQFVYTLSTSALAEVAMALGLHGEVLALGAGAASGLQALLSAAVRVTAGRVPACLAGACDVGGGGAERIALFLVEPDTGQGGQVLTGTWESDEGHRTAALAPPEAALLKLASALSERRECTLVESAPPGPRRLRVRVAPQA